MLNDQIIMLQHGSSNSSNQPVGAHFAHMPLSCVYACMKDTLTLPYLWPSYRADGAACEGLNTRHHRRS